MKRKIEDEMSLNFGENVSEKIAEEYKPDAAVLETQVNPEIYERDECQNCGNPYESLGNCPACMNNRTKREYLKNLKRKEGGK